MQDQSLSKMLQYTMHKMEITQAQVAEKLGLNQSTISRCLTEPNKNPRYSTGRQIESLYQEARQAEEGAQ